MPPEGNHDQEPFQDSWEFGKSGNRIKLYFKFVEDLQHKIKELEGIGFTIIDGEWSYSSKKGVKK